MSNFKVDRKSYNLYDVGGTRVQRRKWIHIMSEADVMIYTFDVACAGDARIDDDYDAMQEQVTVLKALLESPPLDKVHAIIIFTKVDRLTAQAMSRLLSSELFPTYKGDIQSTGEILDHLAREIASWVKEPRKRITFWQASIARSSTELADVALTALEQLDTDMN